MIDSGISKYSKCCTYITCDQMSSVMCYVDIMSNYQDMSHKQAPAPGARQLIMCDVFLAQHSAN